MKAPLRVPTSTRTLLMCFSPVQSRWVRSGIQTVPNSKTHRLRRLLLRSVGGRFVRHDRKLERERAALALDRRDRDITALEPRQLPGKEKTKSRPFEVLGLRCDHAPEAR